jgi:hypothetical protein
MERDDITTFLFWLTWTLMEDNSVISGVHVHQNG